MSSKQAQNMAGLSRLSFLNELLELKVEDVKMKKLSCETSLKTFKAEDVKIKLSSVVVAVMCVGCDSVSNSSG
jgi:hypothetical protein